MKRLQEDVGSEVTNERLKEFIWSTLKSGQVHIHDCTVMISTIRLESSFLL